MIHEYEKPSSRRSAAAVIILVNIAVELIFATSFVCGPTFSRLFHLSKSQLGICLGILNIGMFVLSPLSGYITHFWSPFPTLVTGMVLAISGITLVIFTNGFLMLLGGLALLGIASVFIINANMTFLADLFREKLRRGISLTSGLWCAASSLFAPALGVWLMVVFQRNWKAWGFRGPYLFCLLLIGICLFLIYRVVGKVAKLESGKGKQRRLSKSPELDPDNFHPGRKQWFWLLFISLFQGLMCSSLLAWGNPMVQNKFGVNDFYGALLYGMMILGIAGGRLILAGIKVAMDDRVILAFSAIVGATLFGLGLAAPLYSITVVAMTVGSLAASATYPCILSLVGTKFPKEKAKVYGYTTASGALAGLISPSLIGFLADRGVPLWWAMGISPLAGFLLSFGSLLWKYQDHRVKSSISH